MSPPYRTRIEDVPLEQGLREDDGWIDMQVQFLIDARAAGSNDLVVGRTVLPPGARHERHLHPNCDEFLVVLSGSGEIYTDSGREPSKAGDVVFTPRGHWHGFDNTATRTCSCSGAGAAPARSRRPATSGLEQALGWKVGFGSSAAFERLGTDRPRFAGFMLRSNVLHTTARRSTSGGWEGTRRWSSRSPSTSERTSRSRASAAAIELVDTTPLSTDPHEILATNIYHRHVILGPIDHARHDGKGVTGRLLKNGEEGSNAPTTPPRSAGGEDRRSGREDRRAAGAVRRGLSAGAT